MQRKKYLYIYLAFVAVCLLVTGYRCAERTEVTEEESYGITTDDAVEVNEGTKVESTFKLTGDTLQGISVKFQTKKVFQKERLKAKLFDAVTGELLAEDSVALKYERIQNKDGGSFIYFNLPVNGRKDKNVRLALTLDGSGFVYPSLVISKKQINSSYLIIDGEGSESKLVFKTRYYMGTSNNAAKVIGSSIVAIAFGTVLFLFIFLGGGWEEEAAKKNRILIVADSVNEYAVILMKRYGRFIKVILLFGFLCFYILYVYKYGVSNAVREEGYFFLKKMYAVLGALVLLAAALIYYVCSIRRLAMEKMFVPIALSLGTLFCLVIGVDTVPDEPSHIDTAYALSNEFMGIPESGKPGYIYKRIEDIDSGAEKRQSLGADNYKWMYEKLFCAAEDASLAECAVRSNLSNGGKIYYVPQAVGISIGRILNLGLLPAIMLGRFFSLLCYIVLVYFAVKIIPVGKLSLLFVAILPISLQQAASVSYDGMINGISFLYLAFSVYIIYSDRRLRFLDVSAIAFTGSLLATVKGGVYIPLCLLPLMIFWRRKNVLKKERYCAVFLTGLFVLAFVMGRFADILSRFATVQGTKTGGAENQEIYTFGYLISHPVRAVGLYTNTVHKQGDLQLRNLLGGNLAWRDVNIDWYIVILILLLILLSCIRQDKETYIPRKDKIFMGLLAFGTFCFVELSMLLAWTPVKLNYITGAQGRYFLPFFLLVLLCLRNSFFTIRRNIERQMILCFGVIDIIVVLQVVLKVLE